MTVRLNPYINLRSSAREALAFYHTVFGGDLNMSTYAEGGMPHDPAEANKIMHGQLDAPNGMALMVSDAPASMPTPEGSNISVSLSGDDEAALRGYWNGLLAGGQPVMPLEKAPWGDTFGMLVDKYGVSWMVNIAGRRG
ncbi:VOC family protein [Devosia sp.]|uniref:VOC family protein n=1 Tax=Devosia sp. TaxID=1871048 RepID=UPI001AD0E501|nr:VOC family protein [Devosia sp.]MBN9334099.1 VOC family protein [Devosia sp.]